MKTFVGFRGILLTIMMTIVLCPSEKKRPHVTGSPSLIRLLVALSIALFTEVVNFARVKRIAMRSARELLCRIYNLRTGNEP